MTMERELRALERPTSSPNSPVKAGVAEEMGLKTRITSALRISGPKGRSH